MIRRSREDSDRPPTDAITPGDVPDPLDESAALADTVSDEALESERPEPVYDNLYARDTVPLDETDPEVGTMSAAQHVRRQVRRAIGTPGGRMLIAVAFALVGIALAIMAAVRVTTPLLVAAGIVAPISLVGWVVCYRQWLGHKRYAYRVLESLGEDVSDFAPSAIFRPARTRTRPRRRR